MKHPSGRDWRGSQDARHARVDEGTRGWLTLQQALAAVRLDILPVRLPVRLPACVQRPLFVPLTP